jgi:hypothetical protein
MAIAIRPLLLPVLALLIGVLALGQSVLIYHESRTVEREGVQAPVQAIQNSKKIKRSGDRITYRADITYTDKDGHAVTAKGAISDGMLKRFQEGQPAQVRYLPTRPDVIRVVGDEDEGSSWLLVIVGAVALGFGSFGIVRKQQRLRRALDAPPEPERLA